MVHRMRWTLLEVLFGFFVACAVSEIDDIQVAISKRTTTVHFMNEIIVSEPAICQVAKVNEDDFDFDISENPFPVEHITQFGLVLGETASFAMIYSITCGFKFGQYNYYPRSVALVSADEPTQPQVYLIDYDSAFLTYQRNGSVLSFSFTF